jgi:predicted RecA/RadA family phage recombinase
MKNYLQHGDTLSLTAPAGGVVSGAPYLIGAGIFGVAVHSAAEGEAFELRRRGVFSGMPKASGAAWAEGAVLYWDNTAKNFTTTVGSNTRVGAAVAAAASGDATGTVLLNTL